MTKKVLWLLFMTLLPLHLMAQGQDVFFRKGNCIPTITDAVGHRAAHRALLPTPNTKWDASKTYKQMVILFSFTDNDFTMDNPKDYYEKLFNEPNYQTGFGKGCIADYFKEQSGGLFNLEFDVYGPVKVSQKAQPYDNPSEKTVNYGTMSIKEATTLVLEENSGVDYSQYDWDSDGTIEQVIFIFAGRVGNTSEKESYGHIWPNTDNITPITTPDGTKISQYSCSGEFWLYDSQKKPVYCGLGTICHEFSHCLGLPDIYPVGKEYPYSSVDEWDLMDGGNFTGWGWCPPNYSALEKMLLGWLTPTELTEPTSVTGMKAVSEGGTVYQIKHTDTEYLLLENRQQTNWDEGLPGKGLVIFYVNYDKSRWQNNTVNSFASEDLFCYRMFHADNWNYDDWEDFIDKEIEEKGKENVSKYKNSFRMNRFYLSTSAYPTETNTELTDTSVPNAMMSNNTLLSKPIIRIQMDDAGLISFDFMKGETGINQLHLQEKDGASAIYDLTGKRVYTPLPGQIYVIKKNGTTKKYMMNP